MKIKYLRELDILRTYGKHVIQDIKNTATQNSNKQFKLTIKLFNSTTLNVRETVNKTFCLYRPKLATINLEMRSTER